MEPADGVHASALVKKFHCTHSNAPWAIHGIYPVTTYLWSTPHSPRTPHPTPTLSPGFPASCSAFSSAHIPCPNDPDLQQSPPPPPPVLADDGVEYKVEKILDSHLFHRKLQYKVKWKGYGIEDILWEATDGVHASTLVKEFYHTHPDTLQAICGIYSISLTNQAVRDLFYPTRRVAVP
ncbi:hypothetical protein C0992_007248 [Termitomyces sp. T32_za158]|nr:hypothetical protein C0992_007248 [Termitomyces sp. T32_za158]